MSSTCATSVCRHFLPRRLFGNSLAVLFAVLLITTILCYPINAGGSSDSGKKMNGARRSFKHQGLPHWSEAHKCKGNKATIINDYFSVMLTTPEALIDKAEYYCIKLMRETRLWFRSKAWEPFLRPINHSSLTSLSVLGKILNKVKRKDPEIAQVAAVYVFFESIHTGDKTRIGTAKKIFESSVHKKLQAWIKTTSKNPRLMVGDEQIHLWSQNLDTIVKELQTESEKLSKNPGVEIALKSCIQKLLPSLSFGPP